MFCRKCGVSIPDDSCFCPKCGTKVQMAASPIKMHTTRPAATPPVKELHQSEEPHHNDWGRVCRDVALLISGFLVSQVGYAILAASTVLTYLDTKGRTYYETFGRESPNGGHWVMAILGFLINVAGAAVLYIAVGALAKRFGAWRKRNKVVGTFLAIVICLVVFVVFALTTSANGGHFGIWDYLIMAAIFGGMWQGGRQTNGEVDNRSMQTRSQSRNAGRSVETRGYLIGTFVVIFFIGGFLFLRFAMSSRETPIDEHVAKVALAAWLSDGADNTLRVALRKHGLERDPSLKGYKAKEPGGWRDLVRWNKPEKYATDHLIQSALLSGFSRKLIEQAKEESQGDPAKMYDFFADRAEVRLNDMIEKNEHEKLR